jgi:hypothetical protein
LCTDVRSVSVAGGVQGKQLATAELPPEDPDVGSLVESSPPPADCDPGELDGGTEAGPLSGEEPLELPPPHATSADVQIATVHVARLLFMSIPYWEN